MQPPSKGGQRTPAVRACRQGGFCLLLTGILVFIGCGEYRPVNPGAQCEIVTACGETIRQVSGHDVFPDAIHGGEASAIPNGCWIRLAGGRERIYIREQVGPGAFHMLHEYQHHLEHALAGDPVGLALARHAFREICTDSFEVGHYDLMTEIQ